MNAKLNISKGGFLIVLVLVVIAALAYFLVQRLEGEPPTMTLDLKAPAIGANRPLTLQVADTKSGLRSVVVAIQKEGKEYVLFEKVFPSAGFWTDGAVHQETLQIPFEPKAQGITEGKAVLRLTARDLSWRRWWHGNQAYQEKEVLIDTRAPEVNVLSQAHYVAQGGAGLVIYRLSEECPSSGVQVGDQFYPGYRGPFADALIYLAFFAVGYEQPTDSAVAVLATDLAGNQGTTGLPHRINARKFKQDTIALSDQFLDSKMPEFRPQVTAEPTASSLEIFMKVNGELRKANYEAIKKITARSDSQIYWKGEFLRLPAAAPRAGFADHRSYMYQEKKIDEQTHMGVDLASLEQSPIPAANTGKVIFADTLGIYGRSVVLDHGFGLFSMYSHMSHMDVTMGQLVNKGEIIGKTGTTGLAGGDHLHFSVMINHTFVNPVEWWDPLWIKNNVVEKIQTVKGP